MYKRSRRFDKLLAKLTLEVEKLNEEYDKLLGELDEEFRQQIFQLNNVSENMESTYTAQDIMSHYMFEDKFGIKECMAKFYKEIAKIKEPE
jgi:hypothetical protein